MNSLQENAAARADARFMYWYGKSLMFSEHMTSRPRKIKSMPKTLLLADTFTLRNASLRSGDAPTIKSFVDADLCRETPWQLRYYLGMADSSKFMRDSILELENPLSIDIIKYVSSNILMVKREVESLQEVKLWSKSVLERRSNEIGVILTGSNIDPVDYYMVAFEIGTLQVASSISQLLDIAD